MEILVITVPLEGFSPAAVSNLEKLVASKATLIKKALGIKSLAIEQTEDALCFPWFTTDTPEADLNAYIQFVEALCDMAERQQRVLAVDRSVENEKYAFRYAHLEKMLSSA